MLIFSSRAESPARLFADGPYNKMHTLSEFFNHEIKHMVFSHRDKLWSVTWRDPKIVEIICYIFDGELHYIYEPDLESSVKTQEINLLKVIDRLVDTPEVPAVGLEEFLNSGGL